MRTHRNITDEELADLGAVRDWDADIAKTLTVESKLLWVHNRRKKFTSLQQDDVRLVKQVNILGFNNCDIKTDFGDYALESGKNVHDACGCLRFCDCYGRLYLLRDQLENTLIPQESL